MRPGLARGLKIGAWSLLGVALLVLVVGAGGFAYVARTESGHRWLADTINGALGAPDGGVTVEGIDGAIPSSIRVRRIAVSDAAGPYVVIEDAAVDLALGDLLHGRVTVESLTAVSIAVDRLPASTSKPAAKTSGALPEIRLPHLPVDITLRRLELPRIALGAPVAGEPVTLTVTGRAAIETGRADVLIAAERTDGRPGQVRAQLGLDGDPGVLTVDLKVQEPTGSVLAGLLGRGPMPIAASLSGTGPLSVWRGRLDASAGEASLALDLSLDGKEAVTVKLAGEVMPGPLLPAPFQPVAGQHIGLDAQATFVPDRSVTLDSLSVRLAGAALAANGRQDLATKQVTLDAVLSTASLTPVGAALGQPLTGAASVTLGLRGTGARPQVALHIAAADLRVGDGAAPGARAVTLDATAVPARDLGGALPPIAVTLSALVEDLDTGAVRIPGDRIVKLDFAGAVDPSAQGLQIDRLALTGPGLTASGQGRWQEAQGSGKLTLSAADLAVFRGLAGLPLKGQVTLDADVDLDGSASGHATLQARGADLVTGIPVADAILGGRFTLDGRLARGAGGAIEVSSLTLDAARVKLTARGTVPAALDSVRAHVAAELPDLRPIGLAVKSPVAGALVLKADIEGPLAAPVVDATLTGRDLASGTLRLTAAEIVAQVRNPHAPTGTVRATLSGPALGAARLDAQFATDGTRTLDLSRLAVAANGATIEGTVKVALDRMLAIGRLDLKAPSLAPWSGLAGQKLAGSADGQLVLSARNGQAAELRLDVRNLQAGEGASLATVQHVSVATSGSDLAGKPSGKAVVTLTGVAAADTRIASAKLDATLDPRGAAFSVDLAGNRDGPLELSFAGTARPNTGGGVITVARLRGLVSGQTVRLVRPLTVTQRGTDLAFADLDLAVAGGSLTGSGHLDRGAIGLDLAAHGVAVGTLATLAGKPGPSGSIDVEAHLTGTTVAPRGRVQLAVRDFRLTDGGKTRAPRRALQPPIAMTAEATLEGATVALKARVSGVQQDAIDLVGTVPLAVRTDAPPSLAQHGPLDIRVTGGGDLANLAEFMPIGEDLMSGRLVLDLRVQGTPADPAAAGSVAIDNGRYLNRALGTELRNIAVRLTGSRERLEIVQLSADDGRGGKIGGSGRVDLAGEGRIDIHATANDFQAVKRDDASAFASLDIGVVGPLAAPKVAGEITIARADINLPDRLPPSVTVLQVKEVDSSQPRAPVVVTETTAKKPPPKPGPVAIPLDVAVVLPGRIFVRGRGLDSEWKGRLDVKGTSAQPVVLGSLDVVKGTFSALGRTFTLERGKVGFDGGPPSRPNLDILAQAKASDVTAGINISGTPADPKLTLTSDPALPQDEILAHVLFGKNLGQITPMQGLQVAQAAASLASGGPGVLDRIRRGIGLDRLTLGSESQGTSGTTGNIGSIGTGAATSSNSGTGSGSSSGALGGATVSGGKYIADGVYVGVEQGAGSTSTRARVEVEVFPNVNLESTVGAGSGTGLGVTWKHNW